MAFRYETNPPELHRYFGPGWSWLWPDEDESLAGDLPTLVHVDDHVMPHVPEDRRAVCVQAGGAIGAWPKRLAMLFVNVYSFEPNPSSFACLCHNAPELNVHKYAAALSDHRGMVEMDFPEHRQRSAKHKENIGGYRVFEHLDAAIPMLMIDDLDLPACDLIMLDVEGFEKFALRGGYVTIRTHRPIICIEDKPGCCRQFGYEVGDIERWLADELGYSVAERFHGGRDVVIVP